MLPHSLLKSKKAYTMTLDVCIKSLWLISQPCLNVGVTTTKDKKQLWNQGYFTHLHTSTRAYCVILGRYKRGDTILIQVVYRMGTSLHYHFYPSCISAIVASIISRTEFYCWWKDWKYFSLVIFALINFSLRGVKSLEKEF